MNVFSIGVLLVTLVGLHLVVGAQTPKARLAVTTLENPTTGSTIGNGPDRDPPERLAENRPVPTCRPQRCRAGRQDQVNFIMKGKVTNFSFDEQAFQENVATARGLVIQTQYRPKRFRPR
jgi:hypothetical protein